VTQRAQSEGGRTAFPRSRTFGTAATTGRQQLSWIWSRESLLRLVLSFVLAVALWLYVTDKQNPSIARDFGQPLTITYTNPPDGEALVNGTLGVVYVRIKQADPNASVTTANFHAWVDLLGLGPGRHRVRVHVLADPGIQIVQQRPEMIPVWLERKLYKHFTVRANIIRPPPTGYGYQVRVDPSTVTVSGPQDVVAPVTRATLDVDLAGVKANLNYVSHVTPENSQGGVVPGLTVSPPQVSVSVMVQPLSSYKTLPVLPQIAGQPKTGYGVVSLVASPAEVTLTGQPERLSSISTVQTKPLSVSHRGAGTFTVRVPLSIPGQTSSQTKYVKVKVRLASVESSSSVQIGVALSGVSPGLNVTVSPHTILTTVAGPQNALRSAGRSVQANLSLLGYGVGTYTLAPTVTARDGLQVLSFYPRAVTVTLSAGTPG
jgi:YbbR domain-containing protein